MRLSTPFASLLCAILATGLPQPLRPKDSSSFHLPINVQLPKSRVELEANRHRARALAKRESPTVELTNTGIAYTVSLGVGSPATFYNVQVDTGSSNTWVGAIKPYVPTNTSKPTGQNVTVTYGLGGFSGTEVIDQLTLGDGIIFTQSIGVANNATENFSEAGFDGILGLGPTKLNLGTLSPNFEDSVPTAVDSLFGQGLIPHPLIGISFEPVVGDGQSVNFTGEIDFGEVDTSKTSSDITFFPITQDPQAGKHWGADASISFGGQEILSLTSGIIDTGTTEVLVPTDAFQQYVNMTGGIYNETVGGVIVTKDQFFQIPSLTFNISGTLFEMTQDAQAVDPSRSSQLGVGPEDVLLAIGDLGSDTNGVNFVMGYAALERFYSVYDTENYRVGLATTPHTYDVVNVPK